MIPSHSARGFFTACFSNLARMVLLKLQFCNLLKLYRLYRLIESHRPIKCHKTSACCLQVDQCACYLNLQVWSFPGRFEMQNWCALDHGSKAFCLDWPHWKASWAWLQDGVEFTSGALQVTDYSDPKMRMAALQTEAWSLLLKCTRLKYIDVVMSPRRIFASCRVASKLEISLWIASVFVW